MVDQRQPLLSAISRSSKFRLLVKHFAPGCTILEVGAGSGWFSMQLRKAGFRVTTLDLEGPADIVGDVTLWEQLGLKPASFDAVVALEVIEHVDCIDALSALCRKDGLIMLSSPHPRWDWVMKLLEIVNLNQKRTSDHCNLTDLTTLSLRPLVMKRPLLIHQVAIFVNSL